MTVRVVVETQMRYARSRLATQGFKKLMAEVLDRGSRFASPWTGYAYNSLPGQLKVDSRCRRLGGNLEHRVLGTLALRGRTPTRRVALVEAVFGDCRAATAEFFPGYLNLHNA